MIFSGTEGPSRTPGPAAGAPVVVGVDGSAGCLAATRVAAREAALRHRPLRIVHAFDWPPSGWTMTPGRALPPRLPERRRADAVVAEAAEAAAGLMPAGDITTHVLAGPAGPVLRDQSRQADLLVIGKREDGGFAALRTGLVATEVVTHSACPVLVARGEPRRGGPVVVGVDGSHNSAAALDFAADEAEARGTTVLALYAWDDGSGTELNADLPTAYEAGAGQSEQVRVLAEALAGVAARHPDLSIEGRAQRGPARRLLRDLSGTAQLMVVGDRGHGGFAGLPLGSVSHYLVRHSGCPTAVVRPAAAGVAG